MEQPLLPEWESRLVEDAIRVAEQRFEKERARAHRRAVQLAREQAYHRLAVAIDRPPTRGAGPNQLSFFPEPTLFDDE
jgi:outer membrane protein TolC